MKTTNMLNHNVHNTFNVSIIVKRGDSHKHTAKETFM